MVSGSGPFITEVTMKRLTILAAIALAACGEAITAPPTPNDAALTASKTKFPSMLGIWEYSGYRELRYVPPPNIPFTPGDHVLCGGGGQLEIDTQHEGRIAGRFGDEPIAQIAGIIDCELFNGSTFKAERYIDATSLDTGTVTRTGRVRMKERLMLHWMPSMASGIVCKVEAQLSESGMVMTGTRRCAPLQMFGPDTTLMLKSTWVRRTLF